MNLTDNQLDSFKETIDSKDNPRSIIDNVEKSYVFVRKCLMTRNKGEMFDNASNFLSTKKANRFNHIAETFALGMLLSKFSNLEEKICNQFNESTFDFENYWLLIALLHDYGYYKPDIDQSIVDKEIRKIGSDIHEYDYDNITYSYKKRINKTYLENTIFNYFRYRVNPDSKDEKYDHGIVGGINGYNSLIKSWKKTIRKIEVPHYVFKNDGHIRLIKDKEGKVINRLFYSENDISIYKQICYDIMQHNMWKPSTKRIPIYEDFDLYELIDMNKRIGDDNPMLMLLSLVDTIEFIKRFCTIDESNKTNRMKHNPSSIANRISIQINRNQIKIIFPELFNFVKSGLEFDDKGKSEYDKWIESIVGLRSWVDIDTSSTDNSITITTVK